MFAATWYFEPGSKSISDRKTGGFMPENFSLKQIITLLMSFHYKINKETSNYMSLTI
jgi:hypothetical protein